MSIDNKFRNNNTFNELTGRLSDDERKPELRPVDALEMIRVDSEIELGNLIKSETHDE